MLNDLNIGNRRIFQHKTIFTSLQRKIERFEKMEQEFKELKKTVKEIKRLTESERWGQPKLIR